MLDAAFGDWKAPESAIPKKNIAAVAAQKKPRVFLIDRPDSPQSLILAGSLASSTRATNYLQMQTANGVFGGTFTSRLNMNLREDKRWSYGARTLLQDAVGQRPLLLFAPVQTDKTAESIAEALKEVRAVVGDRPMTEAEVAKIKSRSVRALPGSFETTSSVLSVLANDQLYGRRMTTCAP